jgi:hypothetical protein
MKKGCFAMPTGKNIPTFERNICLCLWAKRSKNIGLGLTDPDNGKNMCPRNVGMYLPLDMADLNLLVIMFSQN